MVFRFYHNHLSQATRGIATGILSVGMVLICFGALILILPAIFVAIAAGLFFFAGLSCALYAIKIFLAARRMGRQPDDGYTTYRKNVQIHDSENHGQ